MWCYDLNGIFVSGCSQSQFCPSHYQNNLVLSLSPFPVPHFPFLILQKSSPWYKEGSLNTVQRSKLPSREEEISFGRMPLLGTGQNKHMEKGSEWGMLCLGRLVTWWGVLQDRLFDSSSLLLDMPCGNLSAPTLLNFPLDSIHQEDTAGTILFSNLSFHSLFLAVCFTLSQAESAVDGKFSCCFV